MLAPIGIGIAGFEVWRARRQATGVPRLTLAILGVNVLFLLVALALTAWMRFAATRR